MTNHELLHAISDMMDEKLQSTKEELRSEIQSVKSELRDELKSEIRSVKSELRSELKSEIQSVRSGLGAEIQSVRSDLGAEIQSVRGDLHLLDGRVRKIELTLENEITPQIQLLVENVLPAAKKFEKAAEQLDSLQSDMDMVKKAVAEHSEKLAKLA
ncbi:MAG: hypothetical protein HFI88_06015 [Lachnospiraceae bacterium]|jgi:chromosome segregation ATPase|nr:hypothetical protein [Lachnospiraceae bacterium]